MILDSPYISGSIVIENSLTASNAVFSGNLNITGDITSTEGFTGSLEGTASVALNAISSSHALNADNAVSSSFAATSSFADSFTVAGEIVAQTLNVQQVTSSVVYSSGSNVFGNSLSNTQQFTGSLQVSGSSHYILGAVSINKDTADTTLDVGGSITGLGLRTNSTNTNYNFISRDSAGNALFVQSVQSNANQNIATFQYGSATVNAGNIVLQVSKDSSYFTNTNVGIGNTSPRTPLDVTGNGISLGYSSANADERDWLISTNYAVYGDFVIRQSNAKDGNPYSAGTTRLTIDASGNVGIGTTSPALKLHLVGTSGLPATSGTSQNGGIRIENGANNGVLDIGASSATGAPGWIQATDKVDLSQTYNLLLNPNGGNIGIGTTSPSFKLSVNTNGDTYSADFYQSNSGTDQYNAVRVRGAMTSAVGYYGIGGSTAGNTSFRDAFVVGTQSAHSFNLNTNDTVRMTIDSSGNVGIGTTTPGYKLDVSGTGRFSENVTINGTIIGTDQTFGGAYRTFAFGGNSNGFNRIFATTDATDGIYINAATGQGLSVRVNGGGANVFSIASTGAATFSSSVTIGASTALNFGERGGISQDGSYNFNWSTNGVANAFHLQSATGNVGIGTTSPSAKLHVEGNTLTQGLYIPGLVTLPNVQGAIQISIPDASYNAIRFYDTTAAAANTIHGFASNWAGGASPGHLNLEGVTAVSFGTWVSPNMIVHHSTGYVGIGIGDATPKTTLQLGRVFGFLQDINSGYIDCNRAADGTYIVSQYAARIHLDSALGEIKFSNAASGTAGNAVSLTERMRITSSGNVGISNSSPTVYSGYKVLHIGDGSVGNTGLIKLGTGATSDGPEIYASGQNLFLNTNSTTNVLNLVGSNVGIGTTSPTDTLSYGKALDIQSSTGAAVYLRDLTDTAKYGLIAYDGESNNRTSIGAIGTDNYLRFVTVSTERMRITSDGNIITGEMSSGGTYNPVANGWYLGYNGSGASVVNFGGNNEAFTFNQRDGGGTTQIDFRNGDVERGRIEWTTSGTTYNTSSDYRLKTNINTLTGALDKVLLLEPKTFNYIDGNNVLVSGFIAHEVQDIVPEAVTGQKDELRKDGTPKYQGMDHSRLVPFLVGAVKELKAENDALKSRLEALEQA